MESSKIETVKTPNIRWPTKESTFVWDETKGWETQGLSLPFPEDEGSPDGFGSELFVSTEIKDKEFLFNVLLEVSEKVIFDPSIVYMVKKHTCIPFELKLTGHKVPPNLRTSDGNLGAILYHSLDSRVGVMLINKRELLEIRLRGMKRCKQIFSKKISQLF